MNCERADVLFSVKRDLYPPFTTLWLHECVVQGQQSILSLLYQYTVKNTDDESKENRHYNLRVSAKTELMYMYIAFSPKYVIFEESRQFFACWLIFTW